MEIPYTVKPRPDTGLYNAKLGIWLFLASEVMLFGGLFSAYILLRVGADLWPHGMLSIPIGTFNTFVLIFSSVTIVMSWASLKLGKLADFKLYMALTIACAFGFLGVLLAVPAAATIGVLSRFWLRRYLQSQLYLDPPQDDATP